MRSRFCFARVKTLHADGFALRPDPRGRSGSSPSGPRVSRSRAKFILTTAGRRRMSKKEIVRIIKERWRTERMYEDLKGELGPRPLSKAAPFPAGTTHVSVVLCCYAFVVAERVRAFPPLARMLRSKRPESTSRPERHFADSFITARLAIALYLARWLPRCPFLPSSARAFTLLAHPAFSSRKLISPAVVLGVVPLVVSAEPPIQPAPCPSISPKQRPSSCSRLARRCPN